MSPIDPSLNISAVRLAVADLPRSADFYERVLGLRRIGGDSRQVQLGADPSTPALVLIALEEPTVAPRGSTGLFHVAWLHSSRAALAETIRRIAAQGWRFDGASDHAVSEALYLSDPDGLGIEIYADRPRPHWPRQADGSVAMVTEPLDLDDLLASFPDDPGEHLAPGTVIGHVHLKASNLATTERFYEQLGFERQALLPAAAFVSAGGYHHHVGMNTWQSAGGAPAPESAPGLRGISFELGAAEAVDALGAAAGEDSRGIDGQLELVDPDGIPLRFTAAG